MELHLIALPIAQVRQPGVGATLVELAENAQQPVELTHVWFLQSCDLKGGHRPSIRILLSSPGGEGRKTVIPSGRTGERTRRSTAGKRGKERSSRRRP